MNGVEFQIKPRTAKIGELVEQCANNEISFTDLCKEVHAMGFKTASLYEMVLACKVQS